MSIFRCTAFGVLAVALSGLCAAQSAGWSREASAGIARAEYEFRPSESEAGVWSAPNRAQGLRARISADGLALGPRVAEVGAPWVLQLRTTSIGRADAALALARPALTVAGARAELEHGFLREWFVNDERGLELGATIAVRPVGSGSLWIGLRFTGELALRIEEGARSAVLVDARGEARLRCRDLRVHDATGRALEARLAPGSAGSGIRIDDAGAAYPLAMTLLLTGPGWTVDGEQSGARLGSSVAPAGDVNGDGFSDVLVGVPRYDGGQADEGRALLFLGSASGLETTPAWAAESNQVGANFGHSVFTAGDVNGDGFSDVIVGAPRFDNGQADEGRAFVYLGSGAGLAASAAWTAEGNQASAQFGASVATAGDVNGDFVSDVVVGAPLFDNGQFDEGRAFVYLGSFTGLSTTPAWTAESDQAGTGQNPTGFGACVAPAGDVDGDGYGDVLVGAPSFDAGEANEGRAYLYTGSAVGLTAGAVWTVEGDQVDARCGHAVATAGDVNGDGYGDVLVGTPLHDGGALDEGRAALYLGSSVGLATSPDWTLEGEEVQAHLGLAVATAGDVNGDGFGDVLVGAPELDGGQQDEGRAFLYLGSAAGLAPSSSLTLYGDQPFAALGSALATAGDVNGDGYGDWIVGAPGLDAGQLDEGRALVFLGAAAGLATSPGWSAEAGQSGASFGESVAGAGDVNGDGFGDVLVGAPQYDGSFVLGGRATLYLGSADGLSSSPAWSQDGDAMFATFGSAVASAGDVNGDGYADVLVADRRDIWYRVRLYLGSAAGLSSTPAWTDERGICGFGRILGSAGDVNGDGFGDVIFGCTAANLTPTGFAYVYLGSPAGLALTPAWTVSGSSSFGSSAAGAGDVNGDGFSDVVVGESGYSIDIGFAHAYLGSAAGLALTPHWTATSSQLDEFGVSASTAGDVNGDGYSDVLVGALRFGGRAYLYLGSATGLVASPAWIGESSVGDSFGCIVATAGDVDNDGYGDVLVGALRTDILNRPRLYLYSGSASGLVATPAWASTQPLTGFEQSAGPAGDVNGDGYADVVVGSRDFGNGGSAFVYLGNEGRGGRLLGLQQRTKNGDRPIAPLGRTRPDGLFRLRAEFRKNLAGLGWGAPGPDGRLQWELKPLGTPFDGNDTGSSAFGFPLSPPGGLLAFDELATARLDPPRLHDLHGELFRWRARVVTNNPLQPRTPWFSLPGSSRTEAKLRRPPVRLR
ncbi:MAG TPA: FG-GAP-like repeat-containing protein [Planctomycetota bacterium]